jgi:hypothetical protein
LYNGRLLRRQPLLATATDFAAARFLCINIPSELPLS